MGQIYQNIFNVKRFHKNCTTVLRYLEPKDDFTFFTTHLTNFVELYSPQFSNFLWHFGIENTSIILNLHVKCPSVKLKWPLCHLVFGLLLYFITWICLNFQLTNCATFMCSCNTYFPRIPHYGCTQGETN